MKKVVIVMRKDLGMRAGKAIAQGGHAIDIMLELGNQAEIRLWRVIDNRKKICVRVDSEAEFYEVRDKAAAAGLPVYLVTDAGHTEFDGPTDTCLAIGPVTDSEVDPITGHLKLL